MEQGENTIARRFVERLKEKNIIMNEFRQSKLFIKMSFKFNEEGIDYNTKDLDGEFSKFIHFNDIEPRKKCRLYTEKYPRLLHFGLLASIIAFMYLLMNSTGHLNTSIIVGTILLTCGILLVLAYFLIQITYYLIELEDETQLFVIFNRPSEKKMDDFIDEVFLRRKKYYREQYFYINYEGTKEKELGRMSWLKDENIISHNEYNVVVDEINDNLH